MSSVPFDPSDDSPDAATQPPPIPKGEQAADKEASRWDSSVWSRARGALSDATSHAAKIAALGAAGATKTAELGRQSLDAANDATRSVIDAGKNAYAGSTLAAAMDQLDDRLESSGAKKVIAASAGAAIDKLDQVTGKRLIELLEEKLRAQDLYNNILATRLAEALERIARLEARGKHDD